MWSKLSFTKSHSQDSTNWTGAVRTALAPLSKDDGDLLHKAMARTTLDPMTLAKIQAPPCGVLLDRGENPGTTSRVAP